MEYIFPYTLPAAVHLGLNFSENLGSTKYQPVKSVSQLFQVTRKMITDQTEITGITTTDWRQRMWRETTLLTDRVVQFSTAKTYVFSDSVPSLGGISTEPVTAWDSKIKWFFGNTFFVFQEKTGSGRRGRMEFQWKNFPVFFKLGILDEIQKTMTTELKCEPQHFRGRIINVSMYNDLGENEETEQIVLRLITDLPSNAPRFTRRYWSFLVRGSEKKWHRSHANKLGGGCDKTTQDMMLNFSESGHPIFSATNASEN